MISVVRLVRPTWPRALVAATLALVMVGGVATARDGFAWDPCVVPGLRVAGEEVAASASERALREWIASRARAREGRHVVLVTADDPGRTIDEGVLGDYGVRVDDEATVRRVLDVARAGDLLQRVDRAERAKRGEIDVPLVVAIDPSAAKSRIAGFKAAFDAPPSNARLDLEHHDALAEVPGRYLDAEGAVAALERAASADVAEARVVVPVAHVAPRFTRAMIQGLDVRAILASYDTYFSRAKDQAKRGQNIDVAAAKLDGLVLMPGELFSFNDSVGDRSPENGFQRSWEIHKGEMVEGIGGGTCQVASTLYAAAFFSGFDVLERLPHSRPSAYIPMGLDATVVYPDVDLKLRNPYGFPIAVHAKVEGNHLRVELLGASRPARRVQFTREILEALPFDRKVEEDSKLRGATVRVKQHGIAGYKIKRTRLVSLASGATKREETTDSYPPTMEIDEVPVGFDESLLPALPSAASAPAVEDGAPAVARAAPAPPSADAGALVVFIEAPGAHAPTAGQASPPRLLTLSR